jgi:hypothetical protein
VNQGASVPLYSPVEWSGGSSYSHLDLKTYTNTPNALMRPELGFAFAIHSPGPITCSMFSDMGWPLAEGCKTNLIAESKIIVSNLQQEEINFGVANIGNDIEKVFQVSNDAAAEGPLVWRSTISRGKYYSIANGGEIVILEPGESKEVVVRYSPTSISKQDGELEIVHNGSNLPSPFKVNLSGEALEQDQIVQLDPNYPNPFNASTTITYALSKTSDVRLEVFDALGKHVQTLFEGQQSSGRYNQTFRANNVSSGLLIYRLIVDGETKTGKLLLVK